MQLIDQLKVGGRLIAPVGGQKSDQELVQVTKNPDGSIRKESLMGVIYVPLTDRQSQCPGR
jgi:protein-L-isoaspartate(D-aspartate) O-methyltransferase